MNKRFLALVLAALLFVGLVGCGKKQDSAVKLDPSNPVSLTIWHYYNGAQYAAFDTLVSEFNSGVGKEMGIYVESYSHGSVGDLESAVTDAAAGVVGSQALPNIFSSYADTAYSLQQQGLLADLSAYFTQEELDEYVPSYIEEGYFQDDGALYLFPVAKSTEIFMLNETDWAPFAEATGTTLDELTTTEGVTRVAQRYYEWTDAQTPDVADDGKAFYGRDSIANYCIIGMKQMGIDLFDVQGGVVTIHVEKEQIRRLWDNYYVPYINGWFASLGKFRSDDVKTGDLLAYTGSIASAMYFPDQVVTDGGSKTISCVVLPAPIMEGGQRINVQQGASMAVTKSDALHEYAACQFLRWFTAKENNLRFVCESTYLPVRKDANSTEALDQVVADNGLSLTEKAHECLKTVLDSFDKTEYYVYGCFENGYDTRQVLDDSLTGKAKQDKAAIDALVAAGTSRADAVAQYDTDANFDAWYESLCQELEATAYPAEDATVQFH